MKRQDFRFFHRLRVRWAEVDMQKIVFNAHYLMYFDTAIADYWRAIGLPYEAAMEHLEGDLYVKKAVVEFHASARADDQIDVAMRCARIGTSSMQFVCAIFRGDQLLITGELIYVFADPRTQTSRPVPSVLRGILEDYEAGRPVVELLQGEWAAWARMLRRCAPKCSSRSRRFRWRWSGTRPMPPPCMPWCATAWASRWPPGAC
jgi:YbgC/YbaW family acyl-CoA thioester hydrolase